MRDVNEDMDELFKKAAENYPLNTNSGDWNEVFKALQANNGEVNNNVSVKKKTSRRLLWLLLLIPFTIALFTLTFNRNGGNINRKNLAVNNNIVLPAQKHVPENSSKKNTAINNTVVISKPKPGSILPQKQLSGVRLQTAAKSITPGTFTGQNTHDKLTGSSNDITLKVPQNIPGNHKPAPAAAGEKAGEKFPKETLALNKQALPDNSTQGKPVENKQLAKIEDDRITNTSIDKPTISAPGTSDLGTKSPATSNAVVEDPKTDSGKQKSSGNTVKLKKGKSRFYAGLLLGPDVSSVKLQKITRVGFTAGIVAGYRLSTRWSIETGLYVAKKNYYTKGQYFSTNKIPLPYYLKIVNADGNCNMFEVPVNVKYNFRPRKKGNWFAVAGSSSYLMKKEDYSYSLLSNYGQQSEKQVSYKNSTKNWLALLNVSAGYNFNLGKTGMLSIEPYLKLPLNGIGIGSLPLTSSGVYLGFTKNLF